MWREKPWRIQPFMETFHGCVLGDNRTLRNKLGRGVHQPHYRQPKGNAALLECLTQLLILVLVQALVQALVQVLALVLVQILNQRPNPNLLPRNPTQASPRNHHLLRESIEKESMREKTRIRRMRSWSISSPCL